MKTTILGLVLSLCVSGWGTSYPIVVRGADEASFETQVEGPINEHSSSYDAIVVGGGLGGMSASVFLSEHLSVLLLEKEPRLGGLAAGSTISPTISYDRGASYWTRAYEEELKILEHIDLKDYERYAIHEPIDSYLWNGELYEGMWENAETMEKLPASFSVFEYELTKADENKLIPNQPIEQSPHQYLDRFTAAEWIRSMPARLKKHAKKDAKAHELLARYEKDERLDPRDPMKDVIDFLDLYSRSALGAVTSSVSALAFANFYISEIETRYTTPLGTGIAARKMEKMLRSRNKVDIRLRALVTEMASTPNGVEVTYIKGGKKYRARAKHGVFAAQYSFASRVIKDFEKAAPRQTTLMNTLPFTHYSVHVTFVKDHPYRATYDTWTRAKDYTPEDFTDVINGRWMDPDIDGYEGMRDFTQHPRTRDGSPDHHGILSIYHPLGQSRMGRGFGREEATQLARSSVDRMLELYNPLLKARWGTEIIVESVETSRWPYSIHVVRPGFFRRQAKVMRKPFRGIYFAHSNSGTPTFEEALFRGHCAAVNILKLQLGIDREEWSNCPIEQ